jgi:VWFA-related protein
MTGRGPATVCAAITLALAGGTAAAQQEPAATFRAGVDLVRVSAVVRDRDGRFVRDLTVRDFEVLEDGTPRAISDFRHDAPGLAIAFLFDISGSMEGLLPGAREAATHLLGWLDPALDEAAVFTFDTGLNEVAPFKAGMTRLPETLSALTPFGATSLYDAIARTAERLESHEGRRRAVVAFTDGDDNASRLTPSEVSGIASAIDVPVYVVYVVAPIDDPATGYESSAHRTTMSGQLKNLAAWTGGHVFVAGSAARRSVAARQIVDELRHQYLIAFESSGEAGWHRLEVRSRGRDLVVRARSGYFAGQSRPIS